MTKEEKIAVLKKLTPGTVVGLTNGQTAKFHEMKKTKFIGTIGGTRYRIDVNLFVLVKSQLMKQLLL